MQGTATEIACSVGGITQTEQRRQRVGFKICSQVCTCCMRMRSCRSLLPRGGRDKPALSNNARSSAGTHSSAGRYALFRPFECSRPSLPNNFRATTSQLSVESRPVSCKHITQPKPLQDNNTTLDHNATMPTGGTAWQLTGSHTSRREEQITLLAG